MGELFYRILSFVHSLLHFAHSLHIHSSFDISISDPNSLYDSVFLMSFGIEFYRIALKHLSEFSTFKTVLTFGIINPFCKRTE